MSVLTALTAQNTTGVYVQRLTCRPILWQSSSTGGFTDIRPDAVKIGMVSNARIIDAVADRLSLYRVEKHRARPGHGLHQRFPAAFGGRSAARPR